MKEKINDKKEFNRNVCFTFFESYLEGADKMVSACNKEFAYDYLTAIIRYALYKEESENPMINAMVSALKNTIDANQKKRENGFLGEDKEQTEAIIKYYEEHPDATEREVAKAVKCSKGKVHNVKIKYIVSNDTSNANPNVNNNLNNNNNSNLNINGVSLTMGNAPPKETAEAEDKSNVP